MKREGTFGDCVEGFDCPYCLCGNLVQVEKLTFMRVFLSNGHSWVKKIERLLIYVQTV